MALNKLVIDTSGSRNADFVDGVGQNNFVRASDLNKVIIAVNDILASGITISGMGTTQNSTPTATQLFGGVVTQTGATGAGTVTLPTGTQISSVITNPQVGDTFTCMFANLGGSQTLTITGATGSTVIGTAAVGTGKNATMQFVCTGPNTWNVYCMVSA
jgi:hypothetical protein